MAETYKGLTIRIGGDTTRLQSAMKSADSAISSTQTMLNKLTRALKFDGADASGLNRQMDLLANKASESYAAMDRLRKSVEQIKNQKVQLFDGTDSSRSIQRYIDDLKAANDGTVDLAANAAEAREQYSRLNAELEQIYRAINKSAKESEQFEKGFDIRKQIDNLDELESKLLSTGAATEEQIALIRELRPQWQAAFDENQFAQAAAGLDEANNRIEVLKANAKQAANQFAEMSAQMSRVQFIGSLDEQLKQVSVQSDKAADNLSRLQKALDIDPSNYQTFNATSKQISENIELAQRRAVLLRQAIEQLNSRGTAEITDDMRQFANSTEDAEEKLRAAANEVTELRGRLSEARNALKLAEKEADTLPEKFDEASTQVNDLQAQLRRATDNMERMNSVASAFRGSEELSEYNIELRETEALISRLNAQKSSMGSIGGLSLDALMTMGMTLSTTVTPAIIQMGQYAVEAAVDIDAAYRDMRKTVNGTEQDFEALRQAAIDFSTQNVTSADTMLSIQAIGGELGVATDSLKSFSEVVSNLDVATNLNAEEAATQLGQLANIMHMTESDYVSFGDALVRLGNNGASTESQIADIATRIGSMGSIVGMSTPDVLAWASTIASTGQNAEAAGTAISNTMSDIETAVSAGGDSLEAFAQVSQMSADDFARAWEEDPTTALKAFIEGLNAIEDAGGSADATLGALDINAARQKQAIMGLMQTIDMLDDNLQMSQNAWDGISDEWGSAGDAAEEASRKAEGFSGSLSILQNSVQVIGSEIANSFAPLLSTIADAVGDFAQAFTEVDDSTKQAIATFAGIAAAVGPVLMYVRALVSAGGSLNKMFTRLKGASKTVNMLTTALSGMNGVIAGLGATILVAGIAFLVQQISEASRKAEEADKAFNKLDETSKKASTSSEDMGISMEKTSKTLGEITKSTDDTISSMAEMADSFEELNKETNLSIGSLVQSRQAIEQLAGRSNLTSGEIGRLEGAVDTLNDQLGTNYEVVRDAGGAYQIMKDGAVQTAEAIDALIQKEIEELQVNAQKQKLQDLYTQQIVAADNYTDALDKVEDAQRKVDEAQKKYEETGAIEDRAALRGAEAALRDAEKAASDAGDTLDRVDGIIANVENTVGVLSSAADGLYTGFMGMVAGNQALADYFDGNENRMQDFADALERGGMTIEDYSELSNTELTELASRWNSTGDGIIDILADMGKEAGKNAVKMRDAIWELGNGDIANALISAGVNLDTLSGKLVNAGVSTEELASVGSQNLALFAEQAGGDLDYLTFLIDNYNSTPIADKNGNVTMDTVELYGAQGQIYTWNGTQLLDKQGRVVVGIESLETAEGEVYSWNESGQLINTKTGEIIIEGTNIQSTLGEIEVYNGYAINTKTGEVIIDPNHELKDGYDNAVLYNEYQIQLKEGNVNIDYSDCTEALLAIQSVEAHSGRNVYIDVITRYITQGTPTPQSSGVSASRSVQRIARNMSAMSVPAATLPDATTAALAASGSITSGVSLMAARRQTLPDLASNAASLATAYRQGAVSSMSRGEGSIGNAGALMSTRNGAVTTQNVNVTIDGTGTTARIERITLELLDELERLGAI